MNTNSLSVKKPRICFLIYTFNRADKIPKAIESVLNQTYRDFELVLINNGSTDNTKEVLESYRNHEKVRIIHLEENIGSVRGMNFALDQIHGEWFGLMGDDDLLMKNAFEEAMKVVDEMDPSINAVAANGISTATGKFAGIGLDRDQYIKVETIVQKTTGDFFGLTKTELLADFRLNEELTGDANTLWFKVYEKANRYYLHKALMVYNTIKGDTETTRHTQMDFGVRVKRYTILLQEPEYWATIKKYNLLQYKARCFRALTIMKAASHKMEFDQYKSMLVNANPTVKYLILLFCINMTPAKMLQSIYNLAGKHKVANVTLRMMFKNYSFIRENKL